MGVREGDLGTGKSPAFKNDDFIVACRKLFLLQLEVQRPKVILVLGKFVGEFLAPLSDELKDWKRIANFTAIDKLEKQVIQATFSNDIKSNLVLLIHPSLRYVNVGRRRYQQDRYHGQEAELQMVLNAMPINH